ncbi:ABC transporter ATP-binding protein [Actinosynnema sp. NPDC047251]|uniref:Putative ABC transporter ATP-binding protein n=1 Tax=Saccharothrix espanaensis (strain ATCC 51144 / DSM 44229 / JCM 9112 / NBRC 15066 / NRRL 15764) TaxID=1179773 RepID=K0JQN7_SACES|nr:ABC transporter ATP-binding protein [Saccharothrix espanaensis]CCH29745.1 putative ABC transporter ATP-binding protein [Saccharothrix espanaensis DSM 44229]
MVSVAVRARGLGLRYRRKEALRDCSFELAAGRVTALVGANGAGKSTLLKLAAGLLRPSSGEVEAIGEVAFVAQDKPLYRSFTVAEVLRFGQVANPGWDAAYADRLVEEAGLARTGRVGGLSGGQRARLALVVALARRPQVLLLDEPLSEMDPAARQESLRAIMVAVAENATTVVLSSLVLADLEGVCDHLLLLDQGRVRLSEDVETLLEQHKVVAVPRDTDLWPHRVVESRTGERQLRALLRLGGPLKLPAEQVDTPSLDELVAAYLRHEEVAA